MTRTNRQPGELPLIPPPLEPYPAPDDLPTRGADDMGAMAMLTACLIAGAGLVAVGVIGSPGIGGFAVEVFCNHSVVRRGLCRDHSLPKPVVNVLK